MRRRGLSNSPSRFEQPSHCLKRGGSSPRVEVAGTTKRLRDATRTHAHARRQYWIGYIQDTTARLTLAEQCRRLDGRTEERPAFCNYNNTQKKHEITF